MNTDYVRPTTLQALLKEVVTAIDVAARDPRYLFDMVTWHASEGREGDETLTVPCLVCVAGAWLAHNIIQNPSVDVHIYFTNPRAYGYQNSVKEREVTPPELDPLLDLILLLDEIRREQWDTETLGEPPHKVLALMHSWLKEGYMEENAQMVIQYFKELEEVVSELPPILLPSKTETTQKGTT
jgi:hypothetical protein